MAPSSDLENKRVFLAAFGAAPAARFCQGFLEKNISSATVFIATDGQEALFKIDNVVPHVVIIDAALPKVDGFEVTRKILLSKREHPVSVILVSNIPDHEHFVDEVVTGQVQFLTDLGDAAQFNRCLTKALNRLSQGENSGYRLKFLSAGDVLFREGEKASCVYFVKKGRLEALKKTGAQDVVLGAVVTGEFVGEMAHINGEPRSASVRAVSECELIEIPMNTLDMVLFSKPVWAKALVATLSKRLKSTNDSLVKRS